MSSYNIKNSVFLQLSKNQKSALINFLRIYTKKTYPQSVEDIVQNFIDDELYFIDQNNSHFPWIIDFIQDPIFIKDIHKMVKYFKFSLIQKEKLKPFFERQKESLKKRQLFIKENIQKKQKPSIKQIKYYKYLCKSKNINIDSLEKISKFDMINLIKEARQK